MPSTSVQRLATSGANLVTAVRIASAASTHPPYSLAQEDAAVHVGRLSGAPRRAAALARGSQIRERQVILPPEELAELGGIQERNAIYTREAPQLALRASCLALGHRPHRDVSFVATSSCTGYQLPGLSARLAGELRLSPSAARLPLTEAGCAGGVVALTAATDHLRARRGGTALAVAAELCSLALHPEDDDSTLTSNLIFGDGAGAAVLETGTGPGIEILDAASHLVAHSSQDLGFELTSNGFRPVLERQLPAVVVPALEEAARPLLARHGIGALDVRAWLVHPGGARILQGIGARFALEPATMRYSWQSLADHGNTSSAAIFDVLARYLACPVPSGSPVLIAAFGPGVSINLILGRQR